MTAATLLRPFAAISALAALTSAWLHWYTLAAICALWTGVILAVSWWLSPRLAGER